MNRQLKPRYRFDQNAHHFQLLGLKRGECRIDVIRKAARKRATDIAGRSHPATVDLHRAEIAVAAYRLLDPRGRTKLYERVQLSCPLDYTEDVPQQYPTQSPINRKLNLSANRLVSGTENAAPVRNVRIMGGQFVEQAIDQPASKKASKSAAEEGESTRTSRTGKRYATDLTMAERRQFVELLKAMPSEEQAKAESDSTSRSAVDWIRSYLGI